MHILKIVEDYNFDIYASMYSRIFLCNVQGINEIDYKSLGKSLSVLPRLAHRWRHYHFLTALQTVTVNAVYTFEVIAIIVKFLDDIDLVL